MAKIVQMSDGDGNVYPVSNASGTNYCKMPDGTLIQWGVKSVTTVAVSGGSFQYSSNAEWVTFPIAYTTAPFVATNIKEASAYWSSSASAINATNFRVSAGGNMAVTKDVYWVAIGRWK